MIKRIFLPLLAVYFLSLCLVQIVPTDIWWNLSDGRALLSSRPFPSSDPYSYATQGLEWINGSWLSAFFLYVIYALGGGIALTIAKTVIIGFVFFLLCNVGAGTGAGASPDASETNGYGEWMRRHGGRRLQIFPIILCLLFASPRFQVRAEMFGFLAQGIILWLMWRLTQKDVCVWRTSAAAIAAMIFWVNVHPSFPVGLLIIGVFTACGVVRPFLLILAAAATFVNPYGFRIWKLPYFFLKNHAYASENISEWMPFGTAWLAQSRLSVVLAFAAISTISIYTILKNRSRKEIRPWSLLWVVSLAMFFASVRHMSFLAMTSLVLSRTGSLRDGLPEKLRNPSLREPVRWFIIALMVLTAFDRITDYTALKDARFEVFGFGFYKRNLPGDAVRFARDLDLPGRVANNYDIGSLIMYDWPERKVWMDTRIHFRGVEDFEHYLDVMREPEKYWDAEVDRYGIETVMLRHTTRDLDMLLPYLFKHPDWALVYADAVSVIFLRRLPENSAVIEALAQAVDLERLGEAAEKAVKPHWFWKHVPAGVRPRIIPYELYWVAHLYFRFEMYEEAERAFKRLRTHAPDLVSAPYFLGRIAARRKDFKSAISWFEKALSIKPNFAPARQELKLSRALVGFRTVASTQHST